MTTDQQTIARLETELTSLLAERDHLYEQLHSARARLSAIHSAIHAPAVAVTAAEQNPRTQL